jgi:hypothetical protein
MPRRVQKSRTGGLATAPLVIPDALRSSGYQSRIAEPVEVRVRGEPGQPLQRCGRSIKAGVRSIESRFLPIRFARCFHEPPRKHCSSKLRGTHSASDRFFARPPR